MTDKDWDAKFEMLFNEDLIDLPEEFFKEELLYSDPNDLNNIFSELEEKNLYLIHMSQEVEQSLENQKQQYAVLQQKLGEERKMHEKNRDALNEQIQESYKNLNDLKKRNQMTTLNQTAGDKADKNNAEQEVNIEEMLNDMRRDIMKCYKNTMNTQADLHAKQTLDILTEIEVQLETYMKEIHYIEELDESEVIREEKTLKGDYKKRQREENMNKEKEANEKKNKDLKERMKRVYEKLGRVAMPRSMKKKVKREKAEVKVDMDTLDQLRYLGEMQPQPQ